MTIQVVILHSAENDLKDLRSYLLRNFGQQTWQLPYRGIKAAVARLAHFPLEGAVPDELARLNLTQFRQVISGKNRILYEVRPDMIAVHLIADTRRDYPSLLISRLTDP